MHFQSAFFYFQKYKNIDYFINNCEKITKMQKISIFLRNIFSKLTIKQISNNYLF